MHKSVIQNITWIFDKPFNFMTSVQGNSFLNFVHLQVSSVVRSHDPQGPSWHLRSQTWGFSAMHNKYTIHQQQSNERSSENWLYSPAQSSVQFTYQQTSVFYRLVQTKVQFTYKYQSNGRTYYTPKNVLLVYFFRK